jgi:arylsulfatase A-like enzyme
VLVTLDTLRADHLGSYGYPRPTSPFLDRLARDGAVFENAEASAVQTSAAHASLFTGLHPSQHGVRSNGQGFPDGATYEPLAEALQRAGYATAAVSAVTFLQPLMRGFSRVEVPKDPRPGRYQPASWVVSRALRVARDVEGGRPLFLWVHLYDPHLPARAPQDCVERLRIARGADASGFAETVAGTHGIAPGFYRSPEALAAVFSAYDAEICFVDRELERLDAELAAAGRGRALWVVTSDHGEGLGSHDYAGHGQLLYREAVHVPLLFRDGSRLRGRRVRELVRHVDVAPTILARLGLQSRTAGYAVPGRSLLPLLDASSSLPEAGSFTQRRPAPGERLVGWEPGEVYSLRVGRFKYIVHSDGTDEFFDLDEDPLERASLASGARREALGRLARATFASAEKEARGLAATAVDEATRRELSALGYVD